MKDLEGSLKFLKTDCKASKEALKGVEKEKESLDRALALTEEKLKNEIEMKEAEAGTAADMDQKLREALEANVALKEEQGEAMALKERELEGLREKLTEAEVTSSSKVDSSYAVTSTGSSSEWKTFVRRKTYRNLIHKTYKKLKSSPC